MGVQRKWWGQVANPALAASEGDHTTDLLRGVGAPLMETQFVVQ